MLRLPHCGKIGGSVRSTHQVSILILRRRGHMKVSTIWRRIAIGVFAAFLLTLISHPIMAQSQYISGTVVDATGGIVPDATVKVADVAKGSAARETTTD